MATSGTSQFSFYQSERWLRREYLVKRRTPQEIATMCGVSEMTIYRYLEKFKLKR